MLTPDLLRNKLGFVQLKIKKTWKLYFKGHLILDENAINCLNRGASESLREYDIKVNCLSLKKSIFELKTITLRIDYYAQDGFLFYLLGDFLDISCDLEGEGIICQIKESLGSIYFEGASRKAA